PDAVTSLTISGLGTATLSNTYGNSFAGDSVTFTQAQLDAGVLNGLTLHAADDDTAQIHLTVAATTSEGSSTSAPAQQIIDLVVNPVAETPILTASAASSSVNEDGTVALTI